MIDKNSLDVLVNYRAMRRQLKQEYRYSDRDVLHTVWRLVNAHPSVKRDFAGWFNKGIEPKTEVEGITWRDLTSEEGRGLNPYNAFLFMDTLITDTDLGMELIRGQMRPSMRIDPSKLRPELRDYVEHKLKEEEQDAALPDIDAEGNINLNQKN